MRIVVNLCATLLLAATGAAATDYIVRNHCPRPVEWFIGEATQGYLATGESALRTNLSTYAGFFYTNANGGGETIDGRVTSPTRAGFYFEPPYWQYYLVRDESSDRFNVGMSITPSNVPNNGFCTTAACRDGNCTTAYRTPPRFRGPPPTDGPAPDPPVYQCKIPGTNFDIAFCPNNAWPVNRGAPIFPNFNRKKCIDVRGGALANGTPVQIYDCNDTAAQRFELSFGTTQVRVKNTNFCLDAGSNPGNGVRMKIWQCYDNLPAQRWHLTQDWRIALEGRGLCLDLPGGNTANGNVLQTWTCGDYNNNQAWLMPDFY